MFFTGHLPVFLCLLQHPGYSSHDTRLPFESAVPVQPQPHRSAWDSLPAKPVSTQYAPSRQSLMADFVLFIVAVCPHRTHDFANILINFNKAAYFAEILRNFPIYWISTFYTFMPFSCNVVFPNWLQAGKKRSDVV